MGPCLLRFFIDMVWGAGIILHCAVSTSLPRASRAQASTQTGQKEALPRPPHSQASAQTVKKQPYTGAQTALSQPFAIPLATRNVTRGDKAKSSRHAMGDKGRQSKIISAQRPSIQTPWETREAKRDKGKQSKIISASLQTRCGRQGETNHLSPVSRHAMGTRRDKAKRSHPSIQTRHGRQGETKAKSSQPSVQTRHGRQGETRRNKAKRTHASIQTRHGRQGETKGDKSAQHPSIQTHHGRQGEAKGDQGKQNKIISAQHPDTPWETRGDKGVGSILAPGN